MKVWDTFLFNDELDMLQCRLEELDTSPVYRHILVEARVDHQGNPKPLYYAEHKARYAPWKDKIIHVVAEDLPNTLDPWDREHAQRDRIWFGLDDAQNDDLVLLCDVDEIPSPAALAIEPDSMVALDMALCMFAVDWICPAPTRISVAGRKRHLGRLWWQRNNGPRSGYPLIEGAGWHFTWLGGPDAIRAKARQFCHLELRDMILAGNDAGEWYEQGFTWYTTMPGSAYPSGRRGARMTPASIGPAWPAYIRDRRCPASWFRPRPH